MVTHAVKVFILKIIWSDLKFSIVNKLQSEINI
jgi:hypothetical protein